MGAKEKILNWFGKTPFKTIEMVQPSYPSIGDTIVTKSNGINFVKMQNFGLFQPATGKYSAFYLQIILNKIYEGMNSVHFYSASNNYGVNQIADFLEKNIVTMLYQLWNYGYLVLSIKNKLELVDYQKVRLDKNGEVITPSGEEWIVYYSNEYLQKRLTLFKIIAEQLHLIDTYSEALKYLTQTFGSVCVMSGKQLPLSATGKKELENNLKNNLGILSEKSQFLISQATDLQLQQFQFDIKGLELEEKIDKAFSRLCTFFGIPVNLVYTNENSTYDNQAESRRRYYTSCISNYSEIILTVGRAIVKNDMNLLVLSDDLTFSIDNMYTDNEKIDNIMKLNDLYQKIEDDENKRVLNEKITQQIASL